METLVATHRCLEPFRWESLRGWDFRPQLIVVSGLFGGNPFVDGILGHNLLLSRAFFHNLFFFSRWNSGYQEAFFTNFSFFTKEFWLSGSLFHELFFFHDGILAIRKPFSRTFLFSRWNSGYQEAFFTNIYIYMYIYIYIYIYIYHKEYLHRICLVKNLAS
jgi:hypothetical protein